MHGILHSNLAYIYVMGQCTLRCHMWRIFIHQMQLNVNILDTLLSRCLTTWDLEITGHRLICSNSSAICMESYIVTWHIYTSWANVDWDVICGVFLSIKRHLNANILDTTAAQMSDNLRSKFTGHRSVCSNSLKIGFEPYIIMYVSNWLMQVCRVFLSIRCRWILTLLPYLKFSDNMEHGHC